MVKLSRYIVATCTVFAWLFTAYSASAEASKEYIVKTAFIYNFTKFVKWETSPQTLNLCLVGDNQYNSALAQIEKRSNAKVQYKVFSNNAAENKCHIHIYDTVPSKLPTTKHLLTIGEGDAFIKKGGMIAFVKKGGKIKFIINLAAAKAAGLKMNPQLLEIAHRVVR